MFRQVTDPIAGSLLLSALVAALPLIVLFLMIGVFRVKAQGGFRRPGPVHCAGGRRVEDAVRPGSQRHRRGHRLWTVPDPVDSGQRVVGLPTDRGDPLVRGAGTDHPLGLQRPSGSGHPDRLRFWCPARGPGRLRRAGGDCRSDVDRRRNEAVEVRRGCSDRQHRSGRVRRDGRTDHRPERRH